MKKLKMYILVNEDIGLGKGKLAGQIGHAVGSYVYNQFMNCKQISDLDMLHDYVDNHQVKIILKCPQVILENLENKGYLTIRDKGWTQLEPNTLTCVNLGILNVDQIPEELTFIQNLKLL